jgi:mono/diheme cytochrome c family protein
MPAFGSVLSPEQLEAVVAYVTSLDGTQQYDQALGEEEAE